MRERNARAFLIFLSSIILSLGSSDLGRSSVLEGQGSGIRPLVTTTELVKGPNRFAFGLMQDGRLLDDASVRVRLYELTGEEGRLVAEVPVVYERIGSGNAEPTVHRHADGTHHLHTSGNDVKGLYLTRLVFPRAGMWGLELLVKRDGGSEESVLLSVSVADSASTPSVSDRAPLSRNLIASDVKDLSRIDTSPRPDLRLHHVRIADAIAEGRPQLIVFATPQFCMSRMCGPVVEIVRGLLPVYGERVAFVHQEIWQDFPAKKLFPTVVEWRLATEPWIFIVDGQGVIRAKFEGLVTERELREVLGHVLGST